MSSELQALREENIARLEDRGYLDPACLGCAEQYRYYRERWKKLGDMPFAPSHMPSRNCRSGRHAHCTCDTCF